MNFSSRLSQILAANATTVSPPSPWIAAAPPLTSEHAPNPRRKLQVGSQQARGVRRNHHTALRRWSSHELGLSVNSVRRRGKMLQHAPDARKLRPRDPQHDALLGDAPGETPHASAGGAAAANNSPSRPHSAVPFTDSPTTHPRNLSTTLKHIKHNVMMCEMKPDYKCL